MAFDPQSLDSLFRFAIGELVNREVAVERCRQEIAVTISRRPPPYERLSPMPAQQILERRLQQCCGGIQLAYLVSGEMDYRTSMFGAPLVIGENELVSRSVPVDLFKNAVREGKAP